MNNKKIAVKKIALLFAFFFILSIIPLLLLGIYNHPSADDFSFSGEVRQVWLQTGSIRNTLSQAFSIVADRYQTWQGTYTTTFLTAIQPSIWSESFYMATPFIMLSCLIFSVFYLCRIIAVKCLKGTAGESAVISILMLTSMIQCIPDGTESFYWFNGSIHYILPAAASFILSGLLLLIIFEPMKRQRLRLTLSVISAFFVGGGNYIQGLIVTVCVICLLLFLLYRKKLKEHRVVCIPVFFYLVFFLINIAAPGNMARAANMTGASMHPFKAILVSFRYALSYTVEEWLDWTVLILLLLAVPFLWKIVKNSRFSFSCPIVVAVFSYCLYSASFTPGLFAAGNINAPRIQNAIFLLFILMLYVNTGYVLGWLCRRFGQQMEADDGRDCLSFNQALCAGAAFAMLVFGVAITVIPNPEYYTAAAACTELISGEAKAYDAEVKARIEQLSGPEENVTLSPFKNQPKLLYFSDITTDADDWTNRSLCRYYGKESIVLMQE